METAGHSVELNKSGGDSGDAAFTLVKLLNRLDGVHHLVFHREQLAFETVFAHGEDSLFHFVEQIVYLVLFLVSAANALGGGGNDFPQDVLVANDVEVVADVRGGWNEGEQTRDERRPTDTVKKMPIAQYLGKRDQVDRLRCIPKIDENIIDRSVRGDVKVFFVNFLDAFCDSFTRRYQHRPEHALLCVNALRRGAVNILRRTCWRNGDNFFATSRRRTSASAISRFTRLLSCPGGRLSRHLFLFLFCLFFFPAENSTLLFIRLFGRTGGRHIRFWFCCRFHLKNELRGHIVMQLNSDLVLAGVFDRPFQNNFVSVNLCAHLVFQAVHDVLCRH